VHPVRVKRLRPLTLFVVLAWAGTAISALIHGFPGTAAERLTFVAAAAYIVALGLSAGWPSANHRNPQN
jgi:phosphatidylcholine synthase